MVQMDVSMCCVGFQDINRNNHHVHLAGFPILVAVGFTASYLLQTDVNVGSRINAMASKTTVSLFTNPPMVVIFKAR